MIESTGLPVESPSSPGPGAILTPMTPLSLGLVLLSALAHSTWNLMLKKSDDQEVFIFCLLVASAVLLAPLGVTLFWLFPFDPIGGVPVAGSIPMMPLENRTFPTRAPMGIGAP